MGHITRLRALGLVLSVLAVTLAAGSSAGADRPWVYEQASVRWHHDFTNDLIAFWNITRDDYCAWEASGFAGEPNAIEPVTLRTHLAGDGAFTTRTATRPFELWKIGQHGGSGCDMTEGVAAPWATGEVRYTLADRSNGDAGTARPFAFAFRDQGNGMVVDADGHEWNYKWIFEMLQQADGGFHLASQHFTLKPAR